MRIETTQTDREFYMCGVQFIASPIPSAVPHSASDFDSNDEDDWFRWMCVDGCEWLVEGSVCFWEGFVCTIFQLYVICNTFQWFNEWHSTPCHLHAISIPSQPCLSSNLVWFPSRSGNWLSSGLDWPLWKATSTAVEYTWNVFKMITIIFIVVRIGISITITINIWSNSDPRLESPQSSLLPWPLLSYDQNEIWISIYCKIHIEFFVSTISKITCFFLLLLMMMMIVSLNKFNDSLFACYPASLPKDNMLLK